MPDVRTDELPLPVDWNLWRSRWARWRNAHAARLGQRCPHRWPPRNFLADDVIERLHIAGRCVELSEVTFRLGDDHTRSVGLSYLADGGGTEDATVAHTFAELEALLWP